MFQFERDGMYQMPVHFGPACGPRRGPDGERLYKRGAQESIQHTLVYETEEEKIAAFLPEGFSVRSPYITVTHKMHRNLPWLAGRGYNVVTVNCFVTYAGEERINGQYQLAIWENHADPIISGREQLGYSKIFADIDDLSMKATHRSASMSSWDFRFMTLAFDTDAPPQDEDLLKEILADQDGEGLMHLKYIPRSEAPFHQADVCYVALTPKAFPVPADADTLPDPVRIYCTGEMSLQIPAWEDMPTQYHIVRGLGTLNVRKIIGASVLETKHFNDVYHQRVVTYPYGC